MAGLTDAQQHDGNDVGQLCHHALAHHVLAICNSRGRVQVGEQFGPMRATCEGAITHGIGYHAPAICSGMC